MEKLKETNIHEKWKNIAYYRNIFSSKYQEIMNASTQEEMIKHLKEAYSYFKESSYIYFNDLEVLPFLLKDIYRLENLLNSYYICDTEIELIEDFPLEMFTTPTQFLDYLVNRSRIKVLEKIKSKNPFIENINDSTLCNNCLIACNIFQKEFYNYKKFRKSDICDVVTIYPGFTSENDIKLNYNYHDFCLVSLEDKKYLVDCTYKQFFVTSFNLPECIELVGYAGCNPGFYMLKDSYRKQVAMQILEKGWIEITEENFKSYLDGFALSFRNGLYYESFNHISYNTNYTSEDYCNFLLGKDNQLNYESKEQLGLQKRPLFNSNLNF